MCDLAESSCLLLSVLPLLSASCMSFLPDALSLARKEKGEEGGGNTCRSHTHTQILYRRKDRQTNRHRRPLRSHPPTRPAKSHPGWKQVGAGLLHSPWKDQHISSGKLCLLLYIRCLIVHSIRTTGQKKLVLALPLVKRRTSTR